MIIDTDVLIWHLRGNERARDIIKKNRPFKISVVTYIELVQGMRNKRELRLLLRQFQNWKIKTIHIDELISSRAMFYVEQFHLSHAMQLADALVAATAVEKREPLLTANRKHYRQIPHLQMKPFEMQDEPDMK